MYRPKSEYYDLPTKYDETVVRLLVQSPTRMYVYWEIGEKTVEKLKNKNIDYNVSDPILRITNLTMNYSYEIKIDPFSTNYYINVKDVNCDYKVELGRRYNNQYVSIYESNQVKIPKSSPISFNENIAEEIIYRNCIRLDSTEKFIIYSKRKNNITNNQNYYNLACGNPEENISSISRYKQS